MCGGGGGEREPPFQKAEDRRELCRLAARCLLVTPSLGDAWKLQSDRRREESRQRWLGSCKHRHRARSEQTAASY